MLHNIYETVSYTWAVRALNPKFQKDKKSIDHLSAGIGFYTLEEPSDERKLYVVGYKLFHGELNHGSRLANPYEVEKLNKMDKQRYGW